MQISSTLTITIKKQADNYTIEANGPKGIKVDPHEAPQLEALLKNQEITDTLKVLSSSTASATNDAIQKLGKILFDSLFTSQLLKAFYIAQGSVSTDNGVRLRLQFEPAEAELAALPWETLYDGRNWLSVQSNLPLVRKLVVTNRNQDASPDATPSNQARFQQGLSNLPHRLLTIFGKRKPLQKFQIRGALRILFVGASPKRLADLRIEETADQLEKLLEGPIKKKQIVFDKLLNATQEDLQKGLLKDYHILYFAGHGSPKEIFLDDGQGASIENEAKVIGREKGDPSPVSAETLAVALKGKQTRLVFLAACETSRLSDKTTEGSHLLRGFAQDLAERSNLPAIIAMQYFISDMQAISLTTQFFAALAAGHPVDVAMAEARSVLMNKEQANRDVFSPVLYLQAEDGALFPKAKNWPKISLVVVFIIAIIVGGIIARNDAINQVKSHQQKAVSYIQDNDDFEALKSIVQAGVLLEKDWRFSFFKPEDTYQDVLRGLQTVYYGTKVEFRWDAPLNDQNYIAMFTTSDDELRYITISKSDEHFYFLLLDHDFEVMTKFTKHLGACRIGKSAREVLRKNFNCVSLKLFQYI